MNTTEEPTCSYAGRGNPRVLSGRHLDDCDKPRHGSQRCRGCQPCTKPHCLVCGIEHAAHACPGCLNATRADLNRIVWLCLRAATERAHHADEEIPGGESTVILGPYSPGAQGVLGRYAQAKPDGTLPANHESDADPNTLLMLATWEDDWRETFGHPAGGRATIGTAAGYLLAHLHRACVEHLAFAEFAAEVRSARGRLEDLLRDGDRDEPGISCESCRTPLVRQVCHRRRIRYCLGHGPLNVCPVPAQGCCDRGGLVDEWRCPRCHATYDHRAYHRLVTDTYRDNAPALPMDDILERWPDLTRGQVKMWASRGKVKRRGRNLAGRMLYDAGDVARLAEPVEMTS